MIATLPVPQLVVLDAGALVGRGGALAVPTAAGADGCLVNARVDAGVLSGTLARRGVRAR